MKTSVSLLRDLPLTLELCRSTFLCVTHRQAHIQAGNKELFDNERPRAELLGKQAISKVQLLAFLRRMLLQSNDYNVLVEHS